MTIQAGKLAVVSQAIQDLYGAWGGVAMLVAAEQVGLGACWRGRLGSSRCPCRLWG